MSDEDEPAMSEEHEIERHSPHTPAEWKRQVGDRAMRVARLIERNAPDGIVYNEIGMLDEAAVGWRLATIDAVDDSKPCANRPGSVISN